MTNQHNTLDISIFYAHLLAYAENIFCYLSVILLFSQYNLTLELHKKCIKKAILV